MHALLPTSRDWPLHDAAASRAIEAAALARHPAHTLIERAGLSVARLSLAIAPHAAHIVVMAGPGNNGGDGLIAARHLADAGRRVTVVRIGPAPAADSDAAHALALSRETTAVALRFGTLEDVSNDRVDLVIDALLGLGASRPAQGDLAAAIRAVHALRRAGAPVLAVDLPSGLNADTGQPLGADTVTADHTLSLLTIKPGLLTGEGRDRCGRLWVDDLGVSPESPATAQLIGRSRIDDWQRRFARSAASHKGRHGDVVVLGGAPQMRGAAWLAATAAISAGAGRVYAALPDDDGQPWPARPELMHWDTARWQSPPQQWQDVIAVCGCGGGTAIADALRLVLAHAHRVVLDADALNLIAADVALQAAVTARRAHGLATIMTPHPLEAARLLGGSTAAEVQRDRIAAAQSLARRFDVAVVLKGSGSVIADAIGEERCDERSGASLPSHRGTDSESDEPSSKEVLALHPAEAQPGRISIAINSTGSSSLSTAGTGDVLAGWLGGLWAQSTDVTPFELACTAVSWHGAAAESHRGPMLAADLVSAMAALHDIAR